MNRARHRSPHNWRSRATTDMPGSPVPLPASSAITRSQMVREHLHAGSAWARARNCGRSAKKDRRLAGALGLATRATPRAARFARPLDPEAGAGIAAGCFAAAGGELGRRAGAGTRRTAFSRIRFHIPVESRSVQIREHFEQTMPGCSGGQGTHSGQLCTIRWTRQRSTPVAESRASFNSEMAAALVSLTLEVDGVAQTLHVKR